MRPVFSDDINTTHSVTCDSTLAAFCAALGWLLQSMTRPLRPFFGCMVDLFGNLFGILVGIALTLIVWAVGVMAATYALSMYHGQDVKLVPQQLHAEYWPTIKKYVETQNSEE